MHLLILGAGARSAASSAIRAGLNPTCADLFGDVDLASARPPARIEAADYPDGLASFTDGLAPTPWLYTGAIENWPALVDRISRVHPLLGNPGATLRAVRDPVALAGAVRAAGLPAPEVRAGPGGLPLDGSWLVKPLASGGGRGIRRWTGGAEASGKSVYYQRRVEGLALAALYVGDRSGARTLGITRQFVGRPGSPFGYRGSLGPWPVPAGVRDRADRLGRAVALAFGLVGLFGVDLVLRDGWPWPIEVNPRYTASVEVLEWALGRSLMAEHLRACGRDAGGPVAPPPPTGYAAKAILRADRPSRWPDPGIARPSGPSSFPEVADIPRPGTTFRAGEPVLTVFGRGDSPGDCRRRLATGLRRWRRRLKVECPGIRPGC